MNSNDAGRPQKVTCLHGQFGHEIGLVSDDGTEETYRIAAEYRLGESLYAALQTPAMKKLDELAFFRILETGADHYELESIEDEDEWEAAAEAYDDLLFNQDEMP